MGLFILKYFMQTKKQLDLEMVTSVYVSILIFNSLNCIPELGIGSACIHSDVLLNSNYCFNLIVLQT